MRNLQEIVLHYLVAALWTNEDEKGIAGLSAVCDIDPKSKADAEVHCRRFLKEASPLLTEEWTNEQIGHDIWLTRGGHGAGFWDRDLPNAKEISEICSKNRFHGHMFELDGKAHIEMDTPDVFSIGYKLHKNKMDKRVVDSFDSLEEMRAAIKEKEADQYTVTIFNSEEGIAKFLS